MRETAYTSWRKRQQNHLLYFQNVPKVSVHPTAIVYSLLLLPIAAAKLMADMILFSGEQEPRYRRQKTN